MIAKWVRFSILAMVLCLGMITTIQAQQVKPAAVVPAAPAMDKAVPVEAEWSNPLPPGRLNLGLHFGDQQTETFGDILAPIIQFKSGLMFINPRGTWNDSDGQEFNLGLGYRHLFPERNIIIGGNLFYDLRNTSLDNTFNQFGCGLEFLSTWVDARVNAYLPETGKKTADQYATATSKTQEQESYWYAPTGQGHLITQYGYDVTSTYDVKTLQHYQISEQAMDGFDGEIGVLLPIPIVNDFADVKVFGGYYNYNAHYGDDITGMKGRLEIKPMPSLYLDAAWFEDRALLGSKYSVGARISVPFDLASLSRGKNPFAGALDGFKPGTVKPPFASRMTELVVRDLHIRSDMSDPVEILSDRRILEKKQTSLDRKDFNLVLAYGVTFVDDDNRSGVEDGSWENPYRQINTGVQNAIGTMVYVRDAAQQYYENVVLRDGLMLWGSGAPIYGQGSRFLGGIYPVLNGMGTGPAITLANNVEVAGFQITQPYSMWQADGAPSKERVAVAGIYGNNVSGFSVHDNIISGGAVGIYGRDVTSFSIHNNIINGAGMWAGIAIHSFDRPSLIANISDNRIEGTRWNGIEVDSYSTSHETTPQEGQPSIDTVVDLTLANNIVTGAGGSGLSISAEGSDTFIARVSGIYSGNARNGVDIDANHNRQAVALFVDTEANGNGENGIYVRMTENEMAGALFASHADLDRVDQLLNAVGEAIPFLSLDGLGVGDLLGVKELYRAGGTMQANGNGGSGIYLEQGSYGFNLAGFIGVQANGNGWNSDPKIDFAGSGIVVDQSPYDSFVDPYAFLSVAAIVRSEANGNLGSGMMINSEADFLALNAFVDVRANDNKEFGVFSRTWATNGFAASVMLASDPLLSLAQNLGQMDTSYIPTFGRNEANRNGASGIAMSVNGYDLALGLVLDAQANNNGLNDFYKGYSFGDGIEVDVNSQDGAAIGIVGSTEYLMELVGTVLAGLDIPLDLSQVRTVGPVQANDNAGNGVSVDVTSTYGSSLVGILGVEALRNGFGWDKKTSAGSGIFLSAHANNGGDAMAGLAYVNASRNYGDGIRGIVTATSPNPGEAGEAMLGGINIVADGNESSGLSLDIRSDSLQSSYLVLAGVEASGNIHGSGIEAGLGGEGVAMAALTDIQANGNGNDGISIQTKCASLSGGNSHVWISETAIQDMNSHGDGGYEALISMLPSGSIEANNNGDSGIHINAGSQNNSFVDVGDVAASGNVLGYGILVESDSTDGHGTVNLHDNTTSSNGVNGLRVVLDASSAGTIGIMNNVANGNGSDGISIDTSVGGYLTLSGRSNVAKNNLGDGIDMAVDASGGGSYDFGTVAVSGNNSMTGNADVGMRWVDESGDDGSLSAQNNYWGGEPDVDGDIITDPYLTDDPSVP
jgi:hypothetical protein